MTAAEERFEHMVAMAMQAWDAMSVEYGTGRVTVRGRSATRRRHRMDREHFEAAVRERLAQSAQVYELEIGAARSGT